MYSMQLQATADEAFDDHYTTFIHCSRQVSLIVSRVLQFSSLISKQVSHLSRVLPFSCLAICADSVQRPLSQPLYQRQGVWQYWYERSRHPSSPFCWPCNGYSAEPLICHTMCCVRFHCRDLVSSVAMRSTGRDSVEVQYHSCPTGLLIAAACCGRSALEAPSPLRKRGCYGHLPLPPAHFGLPALGRGISRRSLCD